LFHLNVTNRPSFNKFSISSAHKQLNKSSDVHGSKIRNPFNLRKLSTTYILSIDVHRMGREYSHRLWISAFYRINHKKLNLESPYSVKMMYFRHPASFPLLCASPFHAHTRNKNAPCLQKCCL